MSALGDTMREIEAQVGENTSFHIALYFRMASIQRIQRDILAIEDSFKKCIEVAEKSQAQIVPNLDQT